MNDTTTPNSMIAPRPSSTVTPELPADVPVRQAHEELLELAHAADLAVRRNRSRHHILTGNPVRVTTQIAVDAVRERSPYKFALETAFRMRYIIVSDLAENVAAVEAGDLVPTGEELEALMTLNNLCK